MGPNLSGILEAQSSREQCTQGNAYAHEGQYNGAERSDDMGAEWRDREIYEKRMRVMSDIICWLSFMRFPSVIWNLSTPKSGSGLTQTVSGRNIRYISFALIFLEHTV